MAVRIFEKSPFKALESLEAVLATREAAHAAHRAGAPVAVDLEAAEKHRIEGERLAALVADAERAVSYQRDVVERAKAAEREAEKDRAHAAAAKLSGEHEKLTLQIFAESEALAAKLARLEEMRAEIDAVNAVRGARSYIVDGERRVREIPARTIPASYREETVWVDSQGQQPSQLRALSDGRWVDAAGSPLREETRRVMRSAERFEPAVMPQRLAEAVFLPTLDGKGTIWPVRS